MEEGKTLEHLDFRLERGTLIHGQVTVGRNGKPAPGQTVTLTDNTSGFLVRWASTDKNGQYQFRVGPGIYQIWAEGSKHEGLTAEKQDKIQMNFHLERLARGSLAGTVRTSRIDGKPVAKAIIQGESIGQQGHAGFKVVADSQGRFQTERCRGRMNLYAIDPQGSLATFKTIGEEDETVDIVLLPAGSLTGRLVDSKGNPWQGIRVVGWMTKGPREALEGQGTSEAMTDRDGRFTLVGLVVGTRCLLRAEIGASIETKEVEIKDTQTIHVGDVAVEVK